MIPFWMLLCIIIFALEHFCPDFFTKIFISVGPPSLNNGHPLVMVMNMRDLLRYEYH